MKTTIRPNIIYPFAIAAAGLALLSGCKSIQERRVYERTDANRASVEQTQEGYDTLGRKWNEGETPQPMTQPQSAPPQADGPAAYPVSLTKTAPGVVGVGEEFHYELTVMAAADVADVTVVDKMPAGVS